MNGVLALQDVGAFTATFKMWGHWFIARHKMWEWCEWFVDVG